MLELLAKSTTDKANVAVSEIPKVRNAKAAFDTAYTACDKIRKQVAELHLLLTPEYSTSSSGSPPNRLQVARAEAVLPGLRLQLAESELALETALSTYEHARVQAVLALMESRVEARREMIAELFETLNEAKQLAQQIESHDLETVRLGGTQLFAPVPELLSDMYRPDLVSCAEDRLRQEKWL